MATAISARRRSPFVTNSARRAPRAGGYALLALGGTPPKPLFLNITRRNVDDLFRQLRRRRAFCPMVMPSVSIPLGHYVPAMGAHCCVISLVTSTASRHFIEC